MGKKMEGDERQKQHRARQAKRHGKAPSAEFATTGSAKQRKHLGDKVDHIRKLESRHYGQDPTRDVIRHSTRGRNHSTVRT